MTPATQRKLRATERAIAQANAVINLMVEALNDKTNSHVENELLCTAIAEAVSLRAAATSRMEILKNDN